MSSYGNYIKMVIEVNADIQNYKETVFLGLTARQLIFSVVSLVAGGGVVLLAYPYTGLTAGAYIAVPVAAPVALSGFYSYNGIGFIEMVRLKLHFSFRNRTLLYISTENAEEIVKIQKETTPEKPDNKKWKGSRSRKHITTASRKRLNKKSCIKIIKRVFVFLAVVILLVLAALFYLWEEYGYNLNDIWLILKKYCSFI